MKRRWLWAGLLMVMLVLVLRQLAEKERATWLLDTQ